MQGTPGTGRFHMGAAKLCEPQLRASLRVPRMLCNKKNCHGQKHTWQLESSPRLPAHCNKRDPEKPKINKDWKKTKETWRANPLIKWKRWPRRNQVVNMKDVQPFQQLRQNKVTSRDRVTSLTAVPSRKKGWVRGTWVCWGRGVNCNNHFRGSNLATSSKAEGKHPSAYTPQPNPCAEARRLSARISSLQQRRMKIESSLSV